MGAMQAQLVGLIGEVRTSAESIATASAPIAQAAAKEIKGLISLAASNGAR